MRKSRKPIATGTFYEADSISLNKQIESYLKVPSAKKIFSKAIIVPHAGYIYSGNVAAAVYAKINIPELCILIGPNHTGVGKPHAIYPAESWSTPLGEIEIDSSFSSALVKRSKLFEFDEHAHVREHSLEVQIPFLQYLSKTTKIVPICIGSEKDNILYELGIVIAEEIIQSKKNVLIVVSSDLNHYEPQESSEKKDKQVIDAILKMDEHLLMERVRSEEISMCGVAPTYIMLVAAKKLGAKNTELVKYSTSGEVSHDFDAVVGYAGIIIS